MNRPPPAPPYQRYRGPSAGDPTRFAFAFIGVTVVLNLIAFGVALRDSSFLAGAIAFYYSPILNFFLALISLTATSFLRVRSSDFVLGTHIAISLGVPIAATVLNYFLITSLDLHGC